MKTRMLLLVFIVLTHFPYASTSEGKYIYAKSVRIECKKEKEATNSSLSAILIWTHICSDATSILKPETHLILY